MKVVYKIDLSKHVKLFALAHALRQADMNAECAKKSLEKKDDTEALCVVRSVQLLANSLFSQFWDIAHEMAGDEFVKNKAMLNMQDGIVEFYDEKLEDCECDEPECEADNSAGSLDDMLKGIEGIESADDHVERLADDLRNKRGGQA